MSTYGVRLSEGHQAVGIFWAESLYELFWAIDECWDPQECEIKKLKAGGIMWKGKTDIQFEVETDIQFSDEGDDVPVSFDGASYSEQTSMDLHSSDGWRPVQIEWGYPDREATA